MQWRIIVAMTVQWDIDLCQAEPVECQAEPVERQPEHVKCQPELVEGGFVN